MGTIARERFERNPIRGLMATVVFFLFAWSSYVHAAVAVSTTKTADTGSGTASSLTITSFTVSGSNRLLLVGVSITKSSGQYVTSVTYGGTALTAIGTAEYGTTTGVRVELWQLLAPTTGTANVVVNMSAAARFVAGAELLIGVDQDYPLGTYQGNNGNSSSPSVTVSSNAGELVVDMVGHLYRYTSLTVDSSQAEWWRDNTTSGTDSENTRGASSTKDGAGTVTMSWSLSRNRNWAIVAVPVRAVANLEDFAYRKAITIDRSKVGVSGTSATALSNYPILINITDADLKSDTYGGYVKHSNGYDIMFRGLDAGVCGVPGTNSCDLSHEFETYNEQTGNLVVWVQIPSLNTISAASNTVIYMYFSNGAIVDPLEDPTGVWEGNFQAVWHMSDNAASTTVAESTPVTAIGDGVAAADTDTLTTGGQVTSALSFNGTSDYIYQSNSTAISNPQYHTVSAWMKTGTASGHKVVGFDSKQTGTTSSNKDRHLYVGSDGYVYAACYSNKTAYVAVSTGTLTDNSWHYLVAHVNDFSNNLNLYVDGTLNQSVSVGGQCQDYNGYWRMGAYKNSGWPNGSDGYYAGDVDEVRISSTIRDADWIKTDFNNQSSPSTFYSIGSREDATVTQIQLISFTAEYYSGLVQLKWKTGYEVSNLGFRIYREDKGGLVRVTPSIIAGSALLSSKDTALASGRTYVWQDAAGDMAEPLRYWLEDIDTNGTRTWHGPVTAADNETELPEQVESAVLSYLGKGASGNRSDGSPWKKWVTRPSEKKSVADSGMRMAHLSKGVEESLPVAASGTTAQDKLRVQWDLAVRAKAKILVREEGWYRVTREELIAAGLSETINPANLQLFAEGEEQPIRVYAQCARIEERRNGLSAKRSRAARRACASEFGEGSWIEFYGTGVDTPWTDARVYWLVEGDQRGSRIGVMDGPPFWNATRSQWTTLELKGKTVYWAALQNGDEENFFGSVVGVEGAEETLQLNHLDETANRDGRLEMELQGVTETSHVVGVEVNGVGIGTVLFANQEAGSGSFGLPSGVLRAGENRIRLLAGNGEEDISLVKRIRVSYLRELEADEEALPVETNGYETVRVGGFASSAIQAMDVTDPLRVTEIRGSIAAAENGYEIMLMVPEWGSRRLLVFEERQKKAAAEIRANNVSVWNWKTWGWDVVIITHREFGGRLWDLKMQQEAEGYRVAIADVEDVYDEFSYGEKTPYALKDFLAKAREDWTIKPKYLLLVGDASFDPRNYLGLGDFDYVPTKLIDTELMETASDDWYGDSDGDGVPEVAVGRLSVRTAGEARRQVAKIVEYRKSGESGEWANRAVLVADNIEENFDFEAASEQLAETLPESMTIRRIFRGQTDDVSARTQVLEGLNAGALLVNYLGHGSVELWRGDLLTSGGAAGLINEAKLPFATAMTCLNGYFSDIYTESLAEALMKARNGGAVAVWASSGLTDANYQLQMNVELFGQLFRDRQTIGDAIIKAKAATNDRDVRKTWILFGDPTMRLGH
ncbi:MAG: hypothetical protein JXA73_22645 [Acidobacteria bacterium]|nr:hypothetical protein [Acidobacteriota bacterium]